jgi:hypothetical protein
VAAAAEAAAAALPAPAATHTYVQTTLSTEVFTVTDQEFATDTQAGASGLLVCTAVEATDITTAAPGAGVGDQGAHLFLEEEDQALAMPAWMRLRAPWEGLEDLYPATGLFGSSLSEQVEELLSARLADIGGAGEQDSREPREQSDKQDMDGDWESGTTEAEAEGDAQSSDAGSSQDGGEEEEGRAAGEVREEGGGQEAATTQDDGGSQDVEEGGMDADAEAQEPSLFRASDASDCGTEQEVEDGGAAEQELQGGVTAVVQREACAVQGRVQPGAEGPEQATVMQPATSTAAHHRHQLSLGDREAEPQLLTIEGMAEAGDTQDVVQESMMKVLGLTAAATEPAASGAEGELLLEVRV